MSNYTYNLNLGWINKEEIVGTNVLTGEEVPLLYLDGKCWITKYGYACLVPDSFLENATEDEKKYFQPLPEGTVAIKYPASEIEPVTVTYEKGE